MGELAALTAFESEPTTTVSGVLAAKVQLQLVAEILEVLGIVRLVYRSGFAQHL